ncbi:hypothetical protein FACS1894198_4270 [Clostridia bacterium]|nr:hypothetical protein FACS1894198_4270 [Clostridia bacterium]
MTGKKNLAWLLCTAALATTVLWVPTVSAESKNVFLAGAKNLRMSMKTVEDNVCAMSNFLKKRADACLETYEKPTEEEKALVEQLPVAHCNLVNSLDLCRIPNDCSFESFGILAERADIFHL